MPPIDGALLQPLARRVADRSFNRVTVDGDTSTNDSYIIAATGQGGQRNHHLTGFNDGAALIAALER